ncbi:AsmA-like C-terminal region-containing protein [Methylocella sp.]|uniref:YhdP family protein n=1 Tax=Methylocella sp. TaxID=1978226 RepID=UPI0037839089
MSLEREESPAQESGHAAGDLDAATLRLSRGGRRRRRVARACGYALAAVAVLVLVGAALLIARLERGPMTIEALGPSIAAALEQRFGHGYRFAIGQTSMLRRGSSPTLGADGLSIADAAGRTLLSAPRAEVSIALLPLVLGKVAPSRLDVYDVELRLALLPDGSIAQLADARREEAGGEAREAVALTPPLAQSLNAERAPGEAPLAPAAASDKPRSLLVKQMSRALRLVVDALTSPDSQIAALDHVAIKRGRIAIDDRTTGQTIVFDGVDLAFDKTRGGRTFSLSVEGPNGRWTAQGTASGAPGAARRLTASLENLSIDELLVAAGVRSLGVDFDMKMSGEARIGLRPDGVLSEAAASFRFGDGYLRFDDPGDEPLAVDSLAGGAHWDGARRRLVIEPTRLVAGSSHGALAGEIAPPEHEGDPWAVRLDAAEPLVAAPERPGQKPVTLDEVALSARLLLGEKKVAIDRLRLAGPQAGFDLAGDVGWTGEPRLRLSASLEPTPISTVTRLWPSFICPPARNYLLDHVSQGIVQSGALRLDFLASDLDAMRNEHAPPDEKLQIDFVVSDGTVEYLDGAPPLTNVSGAGRVTGRTSRFTTSAPATVEAGDGRVLTAAPGGFFAIANSELRPIPATIQADVAGSVEAVNDFLAREALKPYARLPLDPSSLRGDVSGRVEIGLRLGPDMGPRDTTLKINAALANFSAANLLGHEPLEAATLQLSVDPSGLKASGQGRMFGAPATLELTQLAGRPAMGTIRTTIDDAARARPGSVSIPGVTGPIGASIAAQLGSGPGLKADVELDLTRAAIDWPGALKPAGRPGKAKFAFLAGETSNVLDQIVFDAGPLQARGQIELGADQTVQFARFPQVRFSTGDEARLDAMRVGDTMKVMLRAQTLDARPFLRTLLASTGGADAAPGQPNASAIGPIRDIDVDARAGVLTGHNKQALTGFEMRMLKRGAEVKQLAFAGRFGRETLSGNVADPGQGPGQLTILTDDAGSLFQFVDLYRHMEGGRMRADVVLGDQPAGSMSVQNFVLRDEPALRRIVAESASSADAAGKLRNLDAGAMAFNHLQMRFSREGTRLVFSDGVLNGDAIGLTVEGWLDVARDGVDVKGTFVPAYAVNNLFSKIPVVGAILGGSANEGLIGVNYRLEGRISQPSLSINPLSAIAPGIFRQIFGVGDHTPPPAAQ